MSVGKKDHFVEDIQLLSLIETHHSYEIAFHAMPLVPGYVEGDIGKFAATLRQALMQFGDDAVIGVLQPFTAEIDLRKNLSMEERLAIPSAMAKLLHQMLVQNPESFLQAVEQYLLVRQNRSTAAR